MDKKINIGDKIYVIWCDNYNTISGWQNIENYSASSLKRESLGFIIFEDDSIISLAHNYTDDIESGIKQANGIMVIPKSCILGIQSISLGKTEKIDTSSDNEQIMYYTAEGSKD